ncbi:hypothetical protein AFK68_31565 [Hydrocoleum sp. CS-953]|nr:hypothetical protein AFK68_31565 [Hydrocoleum sp. CS-953]
MNKIGPRGNVTLTTSVEALIESVEVGGRDEGPNSMYPRPNFLSSPTLTGLCISLVRLSLTIGANPSLTHQLTAIPPATETVTNPRPLIIIIRLHFLGVERLVWSLGFSGVLFIINSKVKS